MIRSIELGNIRSIVRPTRIELKPITLFLGQNSSGKSTALRTIPLFKQSLRIRSSAPVLWYGDYVDFGSIEEVRSSLSDSKTVLFGFEAPSLDISDYRYPYSYSEFRLRDVSVQTYLGERDGNTRIDSFSVRVGDDFASFSVDPRGAIAQASVNNLDVSKAISPDRYRVYGASIIPQFFAQRRPQDKEGIFGRRRVMDVGLRELLSRVTLALDNRVSSKTIANTTRKIAYSDAEGFVGRLRSANPSMVSWQRYVDNVSKSSGRKEFEELRSYAFLMIIPEILAAFQQQVSRSFSESAYIGPSRATGERYYRHQELAVDQIDAQGRNLPTFLYSLNIQQRESFSRWLEDSVGYSIRVHKTGGHLQITLKDVNANEYHNIADMGYGFSQVLPVLAQIWSWQHRSRSAGLSAFLAIEQPELHLHPAYQSLLADIFTQFANTTHDGEANRLLIETHSEALINRLGELIYEGRLSKDAVAIYVFDRGDGESETTVTHSSFDEKGILNNWPIGFFSSRA